MSNRLATMARFDEDIPEPAPVCTCNHCDEPMYAGDEAVQTYEGDTVHVECWSGFCDEMYAASFGPINDEEAHI